MNIDWIAIVLMVAIVSVASCEVLTNSNSIKIDCSDGYSPKIYNGGPVKAECIKNE